MWQHHSASDHIVSSRNGGEQLDHRTQGCESHGDIDLSRDTTCVSKDRTTHQGKKGVCTNDDMSNSDLDVVSFGVLESLDCHPDLDDLELNDQADSVQVSTLIYSPKSSPTEELLFDAYLILDEVICDALSRYPLSPAGDLHSFQRVLAVLLFAFSPLCLMELAALLRLDSAQHVKQILLPASLFISIPDSEENDERNRAPVRLVDSSVTDFFLDRVRSQQYYVDGSRAHKMLLEACIWVMQRVYAEQGLREGLGWRGAYDYACRNWERHRRVIRVRARL